MYAFAVSPTAGHPEPSRVPWIRNAQARQLRQLQDELSERFDPEHLASSISLDYASTREEWAQAFALLEKNRVQWGLVKDGMDSAWCPIQLALPESHVVIARYEEKVVGAVAVIPDCPIGLPVAAYFKSEFERMRVRARRLVEITPPTVNLEFVNQPGLSDAIVLALLRFVAAENEFSLILMRSHPAEAFSYEALAGFKQVSIRKNPEGGLHACTVWEPRHHPVSSMANLPQRRSWPRLNRELLRYLFELRTDALALASKQALELIHSAYRFQFSLEGISALDGFTPRAYRVNADLPVTLRSGDGQAWMGRVFDLSEGGFFFEGAPSIPVEGVYEATFRLRPEGGLIRVRVSPRWVNNEPLGRLPPGIGFQFLERHPEVTGYFPGTRRARAVRVGQSSTSTG